MSEELTDDKEERQKQDNNDSDSDINRLISVLNPVDSGQVDIENRAGKRGLIEVYAYNCKRCNYTWLPKDFDLNWEEPYKKDKARWKYNGHDLLYREPPKSCARCKSKYWKNPTFDYSLLQSAKTRFAALIRNGRDIEALNMYEISFVYQHDFIKKYLKKHKDSISQERKTVILKRVNELRAEFRALDKGVIKSDIDIAKDIVRQIFEGIKRDKAG